MTIPTMFSTKMLLNHSHLSAINTSLSWTLLYQDTSLPQKLLYPTVKLDTSLPLTLLYLLLKRDPSLPRYYVTKGQKYKVHYTQNGKTIEQGPNLYGVLEMLEYINVLIL